jgi:hypothetical protein
MGWICGQLSESWKVFGIGIFESRVQRRGAHVSTLKIGSRVGVLCFGGIWRIYADLRRESVWGNFNLAFFGGLVEVPREYIEEGGQYVCQFMCLGEFIL